MHSPAPATSPADAADPRSTGRAALVIAALGVVYGDIGTSPLYALRECFAHGLAPTHDNVLGVLSLVLWTLILIVCVKYLAVIVRMDNRGEGGILAMMTLATRARDSGRSLRRVLLFLGVGGACLLYADAMITPAISVLSAVEGVRVATPGLERYVIPVSLAILLGLFLVQKRGTTRVGSLFGPVMVLWFATIGILGAASVARTPQVLLAIDPRWGVRYFLAHGWHGAIVLGAILLVITGAEVLYADLGHFGRRPIRRGWYFVVFPALTLNYLGQGGLLLRTPEAASDLFYHLAPPALLYPLVGLATVATVIASQAVISGAFSLSRQAVQLGYSPRLSILHTSSETIGQIYVPLVNWVLLASTMALILAFKQSTNLAAAYGVAVSTAMLITSLFLGVVARRLWRWRRWTAVLLMLAFTIPNAAFFAATIFKIGSGGWLPLLVAGVVYLLMSTWHNGRRDLVRRYETEVYPVEAFLDDVRDVKPFRAPGVAVFLTARGQGVPRTLLHNYAHNKVLHATTILLTVRTEEVPFVAPESRARVEELGDGLYRIALTYGFSEDPDVCAALRTLHHPGLRLDPRKVTFFLGRETLIPPRRSRSLWRNVQVELFTFMSRNALDATKYFHLPANRVVELGIQVNV